MMRSWAESVPESWNYHAASGFDCPPGLHREAFIYQERVDVYEDHTFVNVWNSYRSNRIMVLSITLKCISRLWSSVGDAPFQEGSDALQAIQELIDDICASVPYQLGTKIDGGPFDQTSVEYPYVGLHKIPAEQRRAAASLGGWNLLEPLKSILGVANLRQGQREWVGGQLRRIGKIYNVPSRWDRPPQAAPAKAVVAREMDQCHAPVTPCNTDGKW